MEEDRIDNAIYIRGFDGFCIVRGGNTCGRRGQRWRGCGVSYLYNERSLEEKREYATSCGRYRTSVVRKSLEHETQEEVGAGVTSGTYTLSQPSISALSCSHRVRDTRRNRDGQVQVPAPSGGAEWERPLVATEGRRGYRVRAEPSELVEEDEAEDGEVFRGRGPGKARTSGANRASTHARSEEKSNELQPSRQSVSRLGHAHA